MNIDRTHRSDNYNRRPHDVIVNTIIVHADGDASIASSIAYVCTPGVAKPPVSYHCIVGRTGNIYELVDPADRAWHAGVSSFNGIPDCNNYSVGVCLSNKQDGVEPFTEDALRSAAEYCAYLMTNFPAIQLSSIVTHTVVALPPGRKCDPEKCGPFNLSQFRELVADYRKQLA
jgi:N-acetyl-anhydromuramyl-L-alanine amidase AmpD